MRLGARHVALDSTSPAAAVAADRARELLTARIQGKDFADPIVNRIADELVGDVVALGYMLCAQSTMTGVLIALVASKTGQPEDELLAQFFALLIDQGITI